MRRHRDRRVHPVRSLPLLALVPVVAALLALSACGSGTSPVSGGSSVSAARTDFTATTLAGKPYDSASATGRPQVLWFWAPWCTICRSESPDVASVAAAFSGKVDFVGIGGRGQVPAMKDFVSETDTGGFTQVSDESGSLWQRFGVTSQPSFVFVDRSGDGTRVVGKLDLEQLRSQVQKLAES